MKKKEKLNDGEENDDSGAIGNGRQQQNDDDEVYNNMRTLGFLPLMIVFFTTFLFWTSLWVSSANTLGQCATSTFLCF